MKKTKKKKSKILPVMYQLSCLLTIGALFGAGCYWMGRCDELDLQTAKADDCYGMSCTQYTLLIGQAGKEAKADKHKYDTKGLERLMARGM